MSFLCCCCRKSSEAPAFELGVLDYPLVRLDRNGGDVSVESSATGDALGGSGVAYTSTAIEQDAAYWELHVEAAGQFEAGRRGGRAKGEVGSPRRVLKLAPS